MEIYLQIIVFILVIQTISLMYGIRILAAVQNNLMTRLNEFNNDVHIEHLKTYAAADSSITDEVYKLALKDMQNYNPSSKYAESRLSKVTIGDLSETEEVLSNLKDMVSKYGIVMASDFYDLLGLPIDLEDTRWGWDDLSTATIHSYEEHAWVIEFPSLKLLTNMQAKAKMINGPRFVYETMPELKNTKNDPENKEEHDHNS